MTIEFDASAPSQAGGEPVAEVPKELRNEIALRWNYKGDLDQMYEAAQIALEWDRQQRAAPVSADASPAGGGAVVECVCCVKEFASRDGRDLCATCRQSPDAFGNCPHVYTRPAPSAAQGVGEEAAEVLFNLQHLSESVDWEGDNNVLDAAIQLIQRLIPAAPADSAPAGMVSVVREAYNLGWHRCAEWANRSDLKCDDESPAYLFDRDADLRKITNSIERPKSGEGG